MRQGVGARLTQLMLAAALLSLQCFPAKAAQSSGTASSSEATVSFRLEWPAAHPSEYSVVVHKDGRAEYASDDKHLSSPQERNAPVESNAEQSAQSEDAASQDAFHKEFTASDTLHQKVFALAEKANFFDGQFEFTNHPVAQTGKKTLSYSGNGRQTSTTFNYSENPAIDELTGIFQAISATIEGGRRLEFDRRFEKLSLDQDLKSLEEECDNGRLQEVQVIAPILQRLANDRTVLHIAQQRAQRILRKSGQPLAPTGVE